MLAEIQVIDEFLKSRRIVPGEEEKPERAVGRPRGRRAA
jgi:hypothetical protein